MFPSLLRHFEVDLCFQLNIRVSKLFQFLSYVSKLTFRIFGGFWGFYFLEASISIFYFSVFVNLEKIILKNFCQTLSLKRGLYTPIHVYSCITLNHFESLWIANSRPVIKNWFSCTAGDWGPSGFTKSSKSRVWSKFHVNFQF